MREKGIGGLRIIILVVVAIALAGAYYLGIQKPVIYPNSSPKDSISSINDSANPDLKADWKIYNITPDSASGYESYQVKLPASWKQVEHSSNFQGTESFIDGQNIYKLTIEEQKNYNQQTGKPFADLKELIGLPYDITTLSVDGQPAPRPLPRAGSESIYKVLFFSKDSKLTYSITLETPKDGSKILEGEEVFNQILAIFKFTN